jgi:uncharacterized protein YeaO (DUF488 family)
MSDYCLKTMRVYDKQETGNGYRVLVDRLWPRGIRKEALALDEWKKEVAPSENLRKWYGHDPDKFDDFRASYLAELDQNEEASRFVKETAVLLKTRDVILLYGAKDEEHNQAVVLLDWLNQHMASSTAESPAEEESEEEDGRFVDG